MAGAPGVSDGGRGGVTSRSRQRRRLLPTQRRPHSEAARECTPRFPPPAPRLQPQRCEVTVAVMRGGGGSSSVVWSSGGNDEAKRVQLQV
jgi:hypothetical protein